MHFDTNHSEMVRNASGKEVLSQVNNSQSLRLPFLLRVDLITATFPSPGAMSVVVKKPVADKAAAEIQIPITEPTAAYYIE